jgi:hypothetical protein
VIQHRAETWRAIAGGATGFTPVVRWFLGGVGGLDISDRVLGTIGPVERSIVPLLGDYSVSRLSLSLDDSDDGLNPDAPSSRSMTSTLSRSRRHNTAVEVSISVDATGEVLPFYRGFLQRAPRPELGRIDFELQDALSLMFGVDLPELVGIAGFNVAETLQGLLTDYSFLTSADMDSTSFDFAAGFHESMSWVCFGSMQDLSLGEAVHGLARSGLGTLYVDESGLVHYDVEAPPGPWMDEQRVQRTFPMTITESNSSNITPDDDMRLLATEIKVIYLGGYRLKRDSTLETTVGRVTRAMVCPYLAWARSAAMAAHVALQMFTEGVRVVSFDIQPPMLGLFLQLNDRIRVQVPGADSPTTYRVITKEVEFPESCHVVAMREGHWDSVLDKTSFTTWDTGTWGSGEMF